MRKSIFLLLISILFVAAAPARAFTTRFIIDDISRVVLLVNGTTPGGLHTGSNDLELLSGTVIKIQALPGCRLESVVETEAGDEDNPYPRRITGNSCEFMVYYGGLTYEITTSGDAAVMEIESDGEGSDSGQIYNLSGSRIDRTSLPAGIYLRGDGSKIIIR